ncbi:hypothetical protein FDP41_009365 [Naegleria fowleri]|uniref:SAC domain-containing protein n=1 Tax=Naegleria fowleri TaxID=5763 RepID=A0A6A5BC44_NAEFO|nr:uncharacterized protein FDP41_009365 [Naegleria fowleri]KAF0972462.1 hypothetical protein FDP41_009365 [Naegleria fowleri]CAG4714568.1 unnamed protein product [Naegleria fowleri]
MRVYDEYELYENSRRFLVVPKVLPNHQKNNATNQQQTSSSTTTAPMRRVLNYENMCLIDRDTQLVSRLSINPSDTQIKDNVFKKMKTMTRIFGVLGIVTLVSGPFLVVILEKEYIGMIQKHKIYRIKKIQFIPFKPSSFKSQTEEMKEKEIQYIEMMNRVIVDDNSFYLSYSLDLTHHLQNTFSTNLGQDMENLGGWRNAHNKYFWNRTMLQSLMTKQMDGFILPVIRGIVEISSCTINGKVFTFGIISRTSTKRAGTRYIMRGADENGYVANFVESEQFVYYDGILSAFLQIRGSIPLIWTQEANLKYTPEIKFLTDKQKQQLAFDRHFQYVLREYQNNVTAVNLCKKTGQESRLSELYTSYVKNVPGVTYIHFDFHNECKNHDTTKLFTMFLPSIKDSMRNIKYFAAKLEDSKEDGTWLPDDGKAFSFLGRTVSTPLLSAPWDDEMSTTTSTSGFDDDFNSQFPNNGNNGKQNNSSLLDFGESTTFPIQQQVPQPHLTSSISTPQVNLASIDDPFADVLNSKSTEMDVKVFEMQNGVFRVNCIDCCDRTNYIETFIAKYVMMEQLYRMGITKSREDRMENYPDFEQVFRQFWVNNGDRVSILYSGTEALKFQKSAQGLLNDGVNSVKRYFLNNFKDSERQKAINLVLGLVDVNSAEEQESNSPANIVQDLLIF